MIEIAVGAVLVAIGALTLIPRIIDWIYEVPLAPYRSAMRVLGWGNREWYWEWSRRLAHIWVPLLFFMVGAVVLLKGLEMID